MTLYVQRGAPQFPTIEHNSHLTSQSPAPSSQEVLDHALHTLVGQKRSWAQLSPADRIRMIEQLIPAFAACAPRWVEASIQAKGIKTTDSTVGEEWITGPWAVLHTLRQLHQSLTDIQREGYPRIPGPVTTRTDGQAVAQVFPLNSYDRVFFPGITAEIWMQPGVTKENISATQAIHYKNQQQEEGKVALVLGAGNVSSIGPLDILYKLFVDNQVVLFKANPVNAYLGPLLEECFQALITPGYLQFVYGGAEEGAYLCNHKYVDTIHITGSDKTFDAIVFGPGPTGAARKAAGQPLLTKPVTGELGNVSPVIIVPGPWTPRDIAYHAEQIVSSLANNAGFNCNASRVLIQHANWPQRISFLRQLRQEFAHLPTRTAYYPGASARYQAFIDAHPEAEQFGSSQNNHLPWALITDVDAEQVDDICFKTEAFCSLFAETTLQADNVVDYIERAVDFVNEQLWGSLNVTLIIHPRTLKDPRVAAALDQAIASLRYGTISINYWAGASFVMGTTAWGAFPGHTIDNIQSGTDVVHNTLMFARPQKSVLRAPFHSIPKPPWFISQGKIATRLFPKLVAFEVQPTIKKLPGIIATALGVG